MTKKFNLYCHTDLIMQNSKARMATKGKIYTAYEGENGDIVILNDSADGHSFSTNRDEADYRHWFNEVPMLHDKASKATVIKIPGNLKIVFNKPYTIFTDGKITGKAKCNPAEEYSAEIGLKLAVDRYNEAKPSELTVASNHHYADALASRIFKEIFWREGK